MDLSGNHRRHAVSEQENAALGEWHEKSGKALGGAVTGALTHFRRVQAGRQVRYLYNQSLFEGRRMVGNSYDDYINERGEAGAWFGDDRLRLVRSAVQTAVAEVYARQKPKPQFMTSGADWRTRRRAKRMDKVCEGILAQRQGRWIDVWALMQDAGTEAALQGVAFIRVLVDEQQKRIAHELVPHVDLFVDPLEGREPQNLFYAQPVDKQKALRLWTSEEAKTAYLEAELGDGEDGKPLPARTEQDWNLEKYDRIRAIKGASDYWRFDRGAGDRPRAATVIRQDSAWHLPDGDDHPGKYAVCINGHCMFESEWTAPNFPFVALRWEDHRDGYFASGLADEGRKLAMDAGELDWRLMKRAIVASGKRTYYTKESVNPRDLQGNEEETLVAVENGQQDPRETVVPPFASGEFEFAQARKAYFWDAIGISQVTAGARREAGVDSGTAIRTLNDIKTGRQIQKAKRFEEAFVDLAHQYAWRIRELLEIDPKAMITWPGKTMLYQLSIKDANVANDTYEVRVAAASMLPNDPAGRQQMVQDAFNMGLLEPDTAKSLIGWPDLEKELEGSQSEGEYIDMLIDRYLDADEKEWDDTVDYESPLGMIMNKPRAMLRFLQAYFQARVEGSQLKGDKRKPLNFSLSLLTRYIRELEMQLRAMREAEAQLQAGQPAGPGLSPTPIAAQQPAPPQAA